MEKIIVVGGGGHAKVVISILKKMAHFDIVGYTEIEDKGLILGVPYLGDDSGLEYWFGKGVHHAAIGIGQIKNVGPRKNIIKKMEMIGFKFPEIISPRAIINEDVEIDEGTVVMDGVVINPGSGIGKFCIINTKSSIDHDCTIGDFVHIAPGVTLSGGVSVGNYVLIGTGAAVIQEKTIVSGCILGAGTVVLKDCLEPGLYVGYPAEIIKK
jgi:sugar O-acyltransferase (sialic acid O-acetyltransferase NeuD family)